MLSSIGCYTLVILNWKGKIQMNIGILGTGFGAYHAEVYKKLEPIDRITIFGRNKEKLQQLKENLQIEITDEIESLMGNPTIDLIDVCLPSSLHKKYVIDALKNGKHVFCETPFSLTFEDAIEMKKAQEVYGKRVFVNQFIKFEPPYHYLFELMKKGELGSLKALQLKRKTPPLWGDLSLNNITTNLMIHDFDFVTWLLGSPDKIVSQGKNGQPGTSHVQVLMNYPDVIVDVEGSSMMPIGHPFTVGFEATFENGVITYKEDGYPDSVETTFKMFTHQKVEDIEVKGQNCYEEAIKHVIECCRNDFPTRLDLKGAIEALDISLKAKTQMLNG